MADQRNKPSRPKTPSAADQFKHITSTMGKAPSVDDANGREEGSTQIRQTMESLKNKLKGMFGLSK